MRSTRLPTACHSRSTRAMAGAGACLKPHLLGGQAHPLHHAVACKHGLLHGASANAPRRSGVSHLNADQRQQQGAAEEQQKLAEEQRKRDEAQRLQQQPVTEQPPAPAQPNL